MLFIFLYRTSSLNKTDFNIKFWEHVYHDIIESTVHRVTSNLKEKK